MGNLDTVVEETLFFVAQKGWTRSREGFFTALVTFLGEKLGLEYALVGELTPDQQRARTVGLYASGQIVPDMEYELRGTRHERDSLHRCWNARDRQGAGGPGSAWQSSPTAVLWGDVPPAARDEWNLLVPRGACRNLLEGCVPTNG